MAEPLADVIDLNDYRAQRRLQQRRASMPVPQLVYVQAPGWFNPFALAPAVVWVPTPAAVAANAARNSGRQG